MLKDSCPNVNKLPDGKRKITLQHHINLALGYKCYKFKFNDLVKAVNRSSLPR